MSRAGHVRMLRLLAAFGVACSGLHAQAGAAQDLRARSSGRVLDCNGAAWPGAEVVFSSRALEGDPGGRLDVVRCKSDARGRFRARLLLGRAYDAWAFTQDEDDNRRLSELVTGCVAAGRIELREAWKRDAQLVRVRANPPWKKLEIASCRVVLDAPSLYSQLVEADARGRYRLPPLPRGKRSLVFENKRGDCVAILPIDTLSPTEEADVAVFEAPRFVPLLLRVVRAGSKVGLAGVTVRQRAMRLGNRDLWIPAGKSDKDGWVEVIAHPYAGSTAARQYYWFEASGGSAGLSFGGKSLSLRPERDLKALRAENKPDITIQAQTPARELRGRVVLGGRALAGRELAIYTANGTSKQTSFYLNYSPIRVRTDEEGRFVLAGLAPRAPLRIALGLSPEDAAALQAGRGHPLAPFAILASTVLEDDVDLGDLHLDRLGRVDVTLRGSDSYPATGARVYLGEFGRRVALQGSRVGPGKNVMLRTSAPLSCVADRRGRIAFLVPRQSALSVAALHAGAIEYAAAEFPGDMAVLDLSWRFRKSIRLTGRVRGRDGRPIPGAVVRVYPTRYPSGFDTRYSALLRLETALTRADGSFEFGLAFPETLYNVNVSAASGARNVMNARVQVATDEDSVDPSSVEVDMPGALVFRKSRLALRPACPLGKRASKTGK